VPDRPAIPAQLRRDVLIEAGYRCAIPHCRETDIQIHHIEGYAVQPEHTFDDLIALCANCHQRVTNGQIDRKAVRQIKANLSVLSHRYGDLERRYLETVATAGGRAGTYVSMQIGFELLMKNLLDDGLVTYKKHVYARMTGGPAVPAFEDGTSIYQLTPKGEEFVRHWLAADSLE